MSAAFSSPSVASSSQPPPTAPPPHSTFTTPSSAPDYSASRPADASATPPTAASLTPAPPPPPSPSPATTGGGVRSLLFSDNPYFSAGFGLMLFGSVLAVARRGIQAGAQVAQRRLLVSLEIPSKDKAHAWFLHWMGAQARAQAMLRGGQANQRGGGVRAKESLSEFLGLSSSSSTAAEAALASSSTASQPDPLAITPTPATSRPGSSPSSSSDSTPAPATPHHHHRRVSPVRIFSHDLSVETSYASHHSANQAGANQAERGSARFNIVPGPGTHWFRYRGSWMRLQRERNGKLVDLSTGAPWETITLTTLASSRHLFPLLLAEARQLALASTEGKTVVYTAWGVEWRPFGKPRRVRQLESVVLAPGKRRAIEDDLRRFLQRGKWYAQRGIPYRRGYLLHGAPGSGKTSFITALAGALDFNICLLNLSERGLTDDKLNHLLSHAPERSIVLLEDVDAAFLGRRAGGGGGGGEGAGTAPDGYQPNVTFSGLLNALDGVASGESRVVFLTTNHVERLDPALVRPGRVDVIEELGDAEPEQVEQLVVRFYSHAASLAEDEAEAEAATGAAGATADGVGATPSSAASRAAQPPTRGDSTASTPRRGGASADEASELVAQARRLAELVVEETRRRRLGLGLPPSGRPPPPSDPSVASAAAASATASTSNGGAAAEGGSSSSSSSSSSGVLAGAARLRPAARGGVSMAELQNLLIAHPHAAEDAVRAFREEVMPASRSYFASLAEASVKAAARGGAAGGR